MADETGRWTSQLGFRVGFIVAIVLQTIAATSWLVRMHADLQSMKVQQEAQDRIIARLDETGSRQVAPLLSRIEENTAYLMRLDMSGGRKELELEHLIKTNADHIKMLQDMYEARTKIIEKAQDAFAQMAANQVRLKNLEDDLAELRRIEQQEHDEKKKR